MRLSHSVWLNHLSPINILPQLTNCADPQNTSLVSASFRKASITSKEKNIHNPKAKH